MRHRERDKKGFIEDMKAEESHNLLSASWGTMKTGNVEFEGLRIWGPMESVLVRV